LAFNQTAVPSNGGNTKPGSLTMLNYNTHIFGSELVSKTMGVFYEDQLRSAKIANLIRNSNTFDFVSLVEVWDDEYKKDFDYLFTKASNPTFKTRYFTNKSNGLGLWGKRPFTNYQTYAFENLDFPDKLKRKGYQAITTDIDGKKVAIFQTHTQASYDDSMQKNIETRKKNLMQLISSIKLYLTQFQLSNFVVTGDFNVPAATIEYQSMVQMFREIGAEDAFQGEGGFTYEYNNTLVKKFAKQDYTNKVVQRLDYYFVSKDVKVMSLKVLKDWQYQEPGKAPQDLSDHYPLLCEIALR